MKRIIILGQSFSNNLGDQSIYISLKQLLLKKGDYEISNYPIKTPIFHHLGEKYSTNWIINVLLMPVYHLPLHYIKLYKLLKRTDLMIIGGGNLMLDFSILSPIQFSLTCLVARMKKVKIAVLAMGAGPIRHALSKFLYRKSLELADVITVRDKYSLHVLTNTEEINFNSKPVTLTADPALTFGDQCKNSTTKHEKTIGISTLGYQALRLSVEGGHRKYDIYIEKMASLIQQIQNHTIQKILLIPTESPDDLFTMNDIVNKLKVQNNVTTTHPKTVDKLFNELCKCDVLIGTRMHSMILAMTQNIPVIGLSWHGKITALFDSLNYNRNCFDLEKFDEKLVAQRAIEILDNLPQSKSELKNNIKPLQILSAKNAEYIHKLISG